MQVRIILLIILFMLTGFLIIQGCIPPNDKEKSHKTEPIDLGEIAALPLTYKNPGNNPSSPEKIELGRLLFYDPVLSGKKDVSCASCHHPEFGYAKSL